MDATCPSLPPNVLTDDKLRLNAHTMPYMAAHGCHLACSLNVQFVIIERFSSSCAIHSYAQATLYKAGLLNLSSVFCKKVVMQFDFGMTTPKALANIFSPGLELATTLG